MVVAIKEQAVEIIRDPGGLIAPQIIIGNDLPDPRATDAVRHFETYLSTRSVPKYLRGLTRMLSAQSAMAQKDPLLPGPWEETAIASTMWHDVLKGMGLVPKWSTRESCFHIDVDDEEFDRINSGLNGLYTMYEAARDRHLYDGANPMAAASATVNRAGQRAARSLFRVRRTKPRTMRIQIANIVERIRRAGRQAKRAWPPSVIMLIDLMIEGLARLSEQIALTLKDWWDASQFGEEINTPNKGDDYARTKVQVFSAAYAARLRLYVDEQRIDSLELAGGERRTLADFRRLAEGGDLATLEAEPLFTNAKGKFFSQSGIGDYYFRNAMQEAGLEGVTSHAIRHAGVCAFFKWVAEQDLPGAENETLKLRFGTYMGWKWPEKMLEHYSEVERRDQATATAIAFLQARRKQLDELEGSGELLPVNDDDPTPSHNDADLERLAELELAA
jgi:integrase